jgi:hypothetical protein
MRFKIGAQMSRETRGQDTILPHILRPVSLGIREVFKRRELNGLRVALGVGG